MTLSTSLGHTASSVRVSRSPCMALRRFSSLRDDAIRGVEVFREMFGDYPRIHVNHFWNRDSLYWGPARTTGFHRSLYKVLTRGRTTGLDGGSDPSSPHFWGDVANSKVTYVRNFVFDDINTLKACPIMPYHDPLKPYVNNWFASSSGTSCGAFCKTISERNQDRLEEEGGACIMYTHFGQDDFYRGGRLNPRFIELMERLAAKGGWFVPVSDLLDYLQSEKGTNTISNAWRSRLERRWLFEKMFITRGSA